MKIVVQNFQYTTKQERTRIMETVKHLGLIVDTKITQTNINNDLDHIYYEHNKVLYKFNRYDATFIDTVEKAIIGNPYEHCPGINYEGHLHIVEIDNRFTNKKYYTIIKNKINDNYYNDNVTINTQLIIDDLFNNQLSPPL